MACRDYKALLGRYVDGELPPEQERLLKDHLPSCDSCRATVRLLRMEDRTIRAALFGPGTRRSVPRPPVRLIRAAVICGLIFGVGLLALHGVYRGLAERVEAAKRPESVDLGLPVRLVASGEEIEVFLSRVSGATGIEIVLTEEGRARIGGDAEVHFHLASPIRLSSLLELIEDFYGLVPETEDGTVRLH